MKIGKHELQLLEAIHEAIKKGNPREGKILAAAIGERVQMFRNAINPGQKDVFKVAVLLRIIEEVDDPAPLLRVLCELRGYFPVSVAPGSGGGGNAFLKLAATAKELGELSGVLMEAYEDGKLTDEERRRLIKEARDIQIAAQEFILEVEG